MECKAMSKMIQYVYMINIFRDVSFCKWVQTSANGQMKRITYKQNSSNIFDEKFADLSQKSIYKEVNFSWYIKMWEIC